MRKVIVCAVVAMMFVSPAYALDGLASLQRAALSDQATECMVHEYTRRYNEVLRDHSRKKKSWDQELAEKAHKEAMKWVKDVWRDADQGVVQNNLKSREFLSAIENFRSHQKSQYPNLQVVY